MRAWRCMCGQEWVETGDRSGFGRATHHIMEAAKQGEKGEHKIIGLVDLDTGELLVKGQRIQDAIAGGYVEPKLHVPGGNKAKGATVGSPTRGRVFMQDVNLDPSLWILFDLARLKWPEEYDDTPQSFADWIAETIFTFYAEHAEELGFDVLLAKSMERVAEQWESQASSDQG